MKGDQYQQQPGEDPRGVWQQLGGGGRCGGGSAQQGRGVQEEGGEQEDHSGAADGRGGRQPVRELPGGLCGGRAGPQDVPVLEGRGEAEGEVLLLHQKLRVPQRIC